MRREPSNSQQFDECKVAEALVSDILDELKKLGSVDD
jgi:hypothetical protein